MTVMTATAEIPTGSPWWVVVLLIVPGTVSAIAALVAAGRARRVDDAVNHRHPDEPRLFDVVKNTAVEVRQLSSRVDETHASVHDLARRVDTVQEDLHSHVEWEMEQKYQTPDEIARTVRHEIHLYHNPQEP